MKIRGLVHVTGESDVGKTTFCLTTGVSLRKVAFFDQDVKGRVTFDTLREQGTAEDLKDPNWPFYLYVDLNALRERHPKEVDFAQAVLKLIDDIPEGAVESLVWDNFTPFEDCIYPLAALDFNKWRQTWATMGVIKGAQQWDVAFQLEERMFDAWIKKFQTVMIITHLKDQNIQGVKTGKKVPALKRVLPQKASFRVWLRMNEQGGGAPVGLILKRFAKHELDPETGEYKLVNVLPRKVNPCTWQVIRQYWDNPLGDRQPTKAEIPNAHELAILDGTFTVDERHTFELMLRYGRSNDPEEIGMDPDKVSAIMALKDKPPGIIVRELKDTYPDITLEQVTNTLTQAEE